MQRGQIYRKGNVWMLRYREPLRIDGKVVMRQKGAKLADYCHDYRTAESVQPLADLILAPINAKTAEPQSDQTLAAFLEHVYLPHCVEELRPSTSHSYKITF